jgi:hypothetical protein
MCKSEKVAKGGELIKDNTSQNCACVDKFLEEAMKSSSMYETDENVDYVYWK